MEVPNGAGPGPRIIVRLDAQLERQIYLALAVAFWVGVVGGASAVLLGGWLGSWLWRWYGC